MNRICRFSRSLFRILSVIVIGVALFVPPADAAPEFITRHAFASYESNPDGAFPDAGIVAGGDGNLYGTTTGGGKWGFGTVYRITRTGRLTILHNFTAPSGIYPQSNPDGFSPQASLVLGPDGDFYGTTPRGGTEDAGTIFKISLDGDFTTLHSFLYTEGSYPNSGLILGKDGNLYGTAANGGPAGAGTLFKITPTGTLTVIYGFNFTDGGTPDATPLQGRDGNFYGTTYNGGDIDLGSGTIYEVTPAGVHTRLASISSYVGASNDAPYPALVQGQDGYLYGTDYNGGRFGNGEVFKILPGSPLVTLYSFPEFYGNSTGAYPEAGLMAGTDGDFYGTTSSGGVLGSGTIFKITPTGTLSVLYNFSGGFGGDPTGTLLQDLDGTLYGTNVNGSVTGIVFSLTPAGVFTALHNFSALTYSDGGKEGAAPLGGLVEGPDHAFYGATAQGGRSATGGSPFSAGSSGNGTIFRMTPQGKLTTLYSFSAPSNQPPYGNRDGASPNGDLIVGSDGSLYGTANRGGTYGNGTVFRLAPNGVFTVLHTFSALSEVYPYFTNTDGASPRSGLIFGHDGNLYGTAYGGGGAAEGTVYKITPDGTFTTLHSFTGPDGGAPYAALTLSRNGNFYGTTVAGGTGNGTAFKMTPQGAVTTLVSFDAYTNGKNPYAPLLESYGSFYGTTFSGGVNGAGTIFRITASGTLVILHAFAFSPMVGGFFPATGLTPAPDGNLYGTTGDAGSQSDGTIYRITPRGDFSTVYHLSNLDGEGSEPNKLILGKDGSLYGTTYTSGEGGTGTFFQLAGVGAGPVIRSFWPPYGLPGTPVTIVGNGLTKATEVRFGGVKTDSFIVRSDSLITVIVPQAGRSGYLRVKTTDGTVSSGAKFQVE